MKHTKLLVAGVVVALVLAAFAAYKSLSHESVGLTATATPGSLLIEQYSPYVQQNGGISSALPIQTTSDLTAGSLTSTGLTTTGTLLVGTGGTTVSHVVAPANCTIIANSTTIAASSTKDVDCAITGLLATDMIEVVATTTTSSVFQGITILSQHASTTAGYATLTLFNGTGAAFTWTGTASTSFKAFGIK